MVESLPPVVSESKALDSQNLEGDNANAKRRGWYSSLSPPTENRGARGLLLVGSISFNDVKFSYRWGTILLEGVVRWFYSLSGAANNAE